jgi:hypothetical protein
MVGFLAAKAEIEARTRTDADRMAFFMVISSSTRCWDSMGAKRSKQQGG